MPVGPRIKIQLLDEEQARIMRGFRYFANTTAKYAALVGLTTSAIGGMIHYFSGPDAAHTANKFVEAGLMSLGLSLSALLLYSNLTNTQLIPINQTRQTGDITTGGNSLERTVQTSTEKQGQ